MSKVEQARTNRVPDQRWEARVAKMKRLAAENRKALDMLAAHDRGESVDDERPVIDATAGRSKG